MVMAKNGLNIDHPVKKVSFFGLGYVGLVSSVCFAHKGFEVVGYDVDSNKINDLRNGNIPIYEPKLEKMLRKVDYAKLKFTHSPEKAVLKTDVTFITVGTPSKLSGSADLSYIKDVAKKLGDVLKLKKSYHLVVVRSTVTPRTTENIVGEIISRRSEKKLGKEWGLCYSPEFLREGTAIRDMLSPDRLIIGESDKKAGSILTNVYKYFYGRRCPPILRTNLINAELIKYSSNAFLAMKISFINEIANICERLNGADVKIVANGMKLDKRIGKYFLDAGLGYGGSCLPKDIKAFISFSKSLGYNPKLLKATDEINELQPYKAVKVAKLLLRDLKGKVISVLGLSFKPNTDDVRNAVSVKIIDKLLEEQSKLKVYDPVAIPKVKNIFGDKIAYTSSSIDCIKGSDCAIIVTEWPEFKKLKPNDYLRYMNTPIIIDGRRIYNPSEFIKCGVKLLAIGLGPIKPCNF